MLQYVAYFAVGLLMLLFGGKFLVAASVDTSRRLGVSPLLIGLTLVAWGTSAPELALNLASALKGKSDLALGNVVGANICNLATVIGIAALLKPLAVEERIVKVELWLNLAIQGALVACALLLGLPRWVAISMLTLFVVYSTWTIVAGLRSKSASLGDDVSAMAGNEPAPMSWPMIALNFAGGLALLGVGGSLASDGASGVARGLGVPEAVIGATIVAIGTTMPEMITTVLAVKRGQSDLAMGNAIGSCLFNTGLIFGLVGTITPPAVPLNLHPALYYVGALALVMLVVARTHKNTVSRAEGGFLLASYVGFLVYSGVTAGR